ncbi:GspE/PulE family protein [Kordiimonas aquimaris]|uniref:GspE/PulE family protein n=1 Tax=Kordiimonas aquimaris TaxID=707591 RepID=UPI0021CE1116|nr:GspE/PulE family protein [Kordiimonas aquimaris]
MFTDKSYEGFLAFLESQKQIVMKDVLLVLDTMVLEKINLSQTVLGLGLINDQTLADQLSSYLDIEKVRPEFQLSELLFNEKISARYLRHQHVLPIEITDIGVKVAMLDPMDRKTAKTLQDFMQMQVIPCAIAQSQLNALMDLVIPEPYTSPSDSEEEADNVNQNMAALRSRFEDEPTVRAVEKIFDQAVLLNASDIHLHRQKGIFEVRFRTDGILKQQAVGPVASPSALMSRIKILAGMDIAEKRLPQDGRARIISNGREVDLRVASMPVLEGESLTVRLLNRSNIPLNLENLGYSEGNLIRVRRLLDNPNGLILVTGPTGSGKTTTLYAALQEKIDGTTKIMSIEDPVEYELNGVTQVSINPAIGLTFPSVLRSVLRHDPDIILIGEIRDRETAEIAIQASLTGHLVLATLHTNTAAGAVHRLLDMGVDDYLITAAVRGAVAQRLVRKLSDVPQNGVLQYQGRCAVAEVLSLSSSVQKLILSGADTSSIEQVAKAEGMQDFMTDGMEKVHAGITSSEEVLRLTMSDPTVPNPDASALRDEISL